MSLAQYKDLCIDATNPPELGRFWAAALGLELHLQDEGGAYLTGPTPGHTVWICSVPEPKSVKHRVHLDVFGTSVDLVRDLGAAVVDQDSFRWVVMTDPEGGEFCLFREAQPPDYRLHEVVIDCTDHQALSTWWAQLIGAQHTQDPRGYSFISSIPNAPMDAISFVPVAESKTTKNRIHIDLTAAAVPPIIDAGATLVRAQDDEIGWTVLADPEGNEFCVFIVD